MGHRKNGENWADLTASGSTGVQQAGNWRVSCSWVFRMSVGLLVLRTSLGLERGSERRSVWVKQKNDLKSNHGSKLMTCVLLETAFQIA